MPISSEPARRALIEAAERLFAERGVSAVSLREIVLAAKQRNSSALHYHFGSREGLLRAVLDQHVDVVRDARLAIHKEIVGEGVPDLRAAARVLVEPLARPLSMGASGRAFCRIVPQVLTDPARAPEDLGEVIGDTAREYAYELIQPYCVWLPAPVLTERLFISNLQVVHAISARAQIIDDEPGDVTTPALDFFVANLCDMFVGALTAPVNPQTIEALRQVDDDLNAPTLHNPRGGSRPRRTIDEEPYDRR